MEISISSTFLLYFYILDKISVSKLLSNSNPRKTQKNCKIKISQFRAINLKLKIPTIKQKVFIKPKPKFRTNPRIPTIRRKQLLTDLPVRFPTGPKKPVFRIQLSATADLLPPPGLAEHEQNQLPAVRGPAPGAPAPNQTQDDRGRLRQDREEEWKSGIGCTHQELQSQ